MDQNKREEFARAMLDDVTEAVCATGCRLSLLCTEYYVHNLADTIVREDGLNDALNWAFSLAREPVLVIMADLPLATPDSIRRVLETDSDVAIVPGRGGGTNVIFMKDPSRFRADYYGASYLDHMKVAEEFGVTVEVIDSFRLSTDVDEKEDLVELMIHGTGKARRHLESSGFILSIEKGRVGMKRSTHEQAL